MQPTREPRASADFLLECLRFRLDPNGAARVRESARGLPADWKLLRADIKAERLAPLLYETLADLDVLPSPLTRALASSHRDGVERNRRLLDVLGRCLRELAAARVAIIVLKGAALAAVVYRSWSVRPMWDLDILIRRADLDTVRGVLEALGYAIARRETHQGVLAEHENELLFRHAGAGMPIDVHWGLFDAPDLQTDIAMEWFWNTAESATIAGSPALILGPEAQILHLCGHLALHHAGEGLRWWHDVAETLLFYGERIDWPELSRRARHYGLLLPVREIVSRVAADWKVPVPSAVLRELHAQRPSRREARVFRQHWRRHRSAGLRFWHDLTAMRSWRQRKAFALANVFPSVAYMEQRYGVRHRLLLPFAYPYRWLRGLLARPEV